ncbi:MAG TPA: decaprenyl-phosphate phosphoribosyltransferase [Kiritimatiellae bacterium]|nr:decaprenyl-phosphate phosphoribosyltransferase [Kiritimatiellia bacterium]
MKRISALIRTMRPAQWSKNIVVLAPFIFAIGDRTQQLGLASMWKVLLAAVAFCLLSSSVYIFNDIRDREMDRSHPFKRYRPIPAGELPILTAVVFGLLLAVLSLTTFFRINTGAFIFAASYLAVQCIYIPLLKNVPLLDLLVISIGFVLRATTGAAAAGAAISPWLLLCAFWLALFLVLCKRRHEKTSLDHLRGATRPALAKYDIALLDQLIAVIAAVTIVSYALYTLWPDTVSKFGSRALVLTIPYVVFGIFRYMDLVYRHELGDRPEKVLLTDTPILLNVLLYGLTVVALLICIGPRFSFPF